MEKVLMGFTFAQLHGLMVDELNTYVMSFTLNQMRKNPQFVEGMGDKMGPFMKAMVKHGVPALSDLLDETAYEHMRKVYDTEEKFNGACDLADRMGNMSVRINALVEKVGAEMGLLEGDD